MRTLAYLHKHLPRRVWDNLFTISLLGLFLVLGAFALKITDLNQDTRRLSREAAHLAVENSQRIQEIQESRIESCERIYEGVRQVLQPFFPPHPRGAQKRQLDKFNARINQLKLSCPRQTATGSGP